jgi:polysaccharide export outer membrane protein
LNGELDSSLTSSNPPPSPELSAATDREPHPAPPPRAAPASITHAAAENAYRIGPLDVLDISVFQVPDLSKTVQVADAGTVNLPLVGEIPAAGKTSREVEHDLTQKLGAKYLNKPQVTVYVREYNSQRVTVEGAVKKPGLIPITGQSTLVRMIATAGGLEDNYDSTVVIFREVDGQRLAARFDIDDVRAGKAKDPPLRAGDVVVVGTSAIKNAYNNVLKSLPLAGVFLHFL